MVEQNIFKTLELPVHRQVQNRVEATNDDPPNCEQCLCDETDRWFKRISCKHNQCEHLIKKMISLVNVLN